VSFAPLGRTNCPKPLLQQRTNVATAGTYPPGYKMGAGRDGDQAASHSLAEHVRKAALESLPKAAPLRDALLEEGRPVFTFGTCPPREGTSAEKATAICDGFVTRSSAELTGVDGYLVYDIQEEAGRTEEPRPFPFKRTLDPATYAAEVARKSGKQIILYKCVVEHAMGSFDQWLEKCIETHGHTTLNLVGGAVSTRNYNGPTLPSACARVKEDGRCIFGGVTIPERHLKRGNEGHNLIRKTKLGMDWFISQAIYDAGPVIGMLQQYSDACKEEGVAPKKIILTFAPCGRAKTMKFIKWLGVNVPPATEQSILDADSPVATSMELLQWNLRQILASCGHLGITIGVNVESVSIFREEIDAAYELFRRLQCIVLTTQSPSPNTLQPSAITAQKTPVSPQPLVRCVQVKDNDPTGVVPAARMA